MEQYEDPINIARKNHRTDTILNQEELKNNNETSEFDQENQEFMEKESKTRFSLVPQNENQDINSRNRDLLTRTVNTQST